MKKTIISIIGIAVMLLAITACRPNYVIVPIPGGGTSSTPSGTPVGQDDDLQAALANGGAVYLEEDIKLPENFVMPENSTIDGNGNTLTVPTGTNPGTGILDLAKSGVTLKNVTLDFTAQSVTGASLLSATARAAGDKFAVLIGSGNGNMDNAPSGITLSNVTIRTGGNIAGINVHTAKNVTLEDITIDKCEKAPISISSSTVIIDGLKADYSSWYTSANTIQVNGMGGSPVHQPSTVTFKSTEGIDAVWVEAVATDYENASAITDADFPKAGEHEQTVINGLSNWKVRYSDQPSKEVKGWMYYAPSQDASTFTLNADSKVAEKAEEDIRAMLTAIAESDSSRKYSVIKLGQDIELDSQLDITIPVTIDGSNKYTISLETVPSGAAVSEKSALFIKSSNVHLKNLTVSGPNTSAVWNKGEYAIKAYGSYDGTSHQITNVTLENVKITDANAGMLVRGAAVTLNGTIALENLEWGGIGVDSQGNEGSVTFDCDLSIASGCQISYTGTGSTEKPAIWTEHSNDSNETVTGAEELRKLTGQGSTSQQTWYVTYGATDEESSLEG